MALPYLTPDQINKRAAVKRLLLRSAAFGAGFAIVLSLIVGSWIWYSGRPEPSTPWNTTAIVAKEPPDFSVIEDGKKAVFVYRVENTTDADYQLDSGAQIRLMFRNKMGILIGEPYPAEKALELPIFMPAKQRAMVAFTFPSSGIPQRESSESDAQFHERLRAYCKESLEGRGFVLFDDLHRYQINLPGLPDAPKVP